MFSREHIPYESVKLYKHMNYSNGDICQVSKVRYIPEIEIFHLHNIGAKPKDIVTFNTYGISFEDADFLVNNGIFGPQLEILLKNGSLKTENIITLLHNGLPTEDILVISQCPFTYDEIVVLLKAGFTAAHLEALDYRKTKSITDIKKSTHLENIEDLKLKLINISKSISKKATKKESISRASRAVNPFPPLIISQETFDSRNYAEQLASQRRHSHAFCMQTSKNDELMKIVNNILKESERIPYQTFDRKWKRLCKVEIPSERVEIQFSESESGEETLQIMREKKYSKKNHHKVNLSKRLSLAPEKEKSHSTRRKSRKARSSQVKRDSGNLRKMSSKPSTRKTSSKTNMSPVCDKQ